MRMLMRTEELTDLAEKLKVAAEKEARELSNDAYMEKANRGVTADTLRMMAEFMDCLAYDGELHITIDDSE